MIFFIVFEVGVWVAYTSTICSVRAADRRTMFVFTHLLQEIRLHSEEWARSALRSLFFSHHSTIFPQQIGLCLPLSLHQQNNIYPEAIGSQFVLSPMLRSHNSNVSSPTWLPLCALCSQFMQYAAALGKLAWLSFEDPFRIPHLALRC